MYAATPNERREWIHHIRECSKELRKSLPPTTEAESITHAPVWEPDSSTTTCLVCRETQFSIINRRVRSFFQQKVRVHSVITKLPFQHHCRKCGKVVCGACSSHKFLLPKISSRPLRVCTPCFHILADLKRSQSVVNIKQGKFCMHDAEFKHRFHRCFPAFRSQEPRRLRSPRCSAPPCVRN